MEPLKNIYSQEFFKQFTAVFLEVVPSFNPKLFLTKLFDDEWENRELKTRMHHTTEVLHSQLSGNYITDMDSLLQFITVWEERHITIGKYDDLAFMFLPNYIEQYGLEEYNVSIKATQRMTQFTSCEFSIRPFIIKYPKKTMGQLLAWSNHKNLHVRRLASEGSRPRLPWAMALPTLKKNPTSILPILENLKNDTSEYVRRSVANNLNDIAKDHPDTVIEIAKRWKGQTKETDWVVKHASRTLLKQGNQELMALFGFGSIDDIKLSNFKIHNPKVKIGDYLMFSFQLKNESQTPSKIRLEYSIYYQKANGSLSKKVFKISEKDYEANSTITIERKQSFKIITTRRFHKGKHQVAIIVNGREMETYDFELVE